MVDAQRAADRLLGISLQPDGGVNGGSDFCRDVHPAPDIAAATIIPIRMVGARAAALRVLIPLLIILSPNTGARPSTERPVAGGDGDECVGRNLEGAPCSDAIGGNLHGRAHFNLVQPSGILRIPQAARADPHYF